jgi:hypothetical protein
MLFPLAMQADFRILDRSQNFASSEVFINYNLSFVLVLMTPAADLYWKTKAGALNLIQKLFNQIYIYRKNTTF